VLSIRFAISRGRLAGGSDVPFDPLGLTPEQEITEAADDAAVAIRISPGR